MNKTLIAAAVLSTLGSTALAQSTVQVYGRANVTIFTSPYLVVPAARSR